MESPISTSLGAMGPLLRKLDMLLLEPSKGLLRLHKGAKRATHLLKDDLEEITWYLEDLSVVEDPPLTAKCWMKEVRELSYDIENYIDCFVLPGHVANTKTRSGRRRRCGCRRFRLRHIKITRLMETNKKLNRRKRVAARISDFRIDAREALERHKRYELHCCAGIGHVLLPASGRLPATWEEGAGIIIDDRMRKFMDSMADDRDLQLKVVSVVGSEGIGKTTLVKVLYHKLKGQFDCRAFIRLTRKPDIKTVLRDILTQVQQQQPHNHCEDPDLLGKIREHLQHKRYLIVIDDLWSASIWDIISCALPGGKMCSRIIISTQIEDIALACCCYHSEYVFKMRPLDEDLSIELFFNSLFSPESDFPQKLKDVLNKTVQICCGFPLAITVIASLLATHPVILMEQWAYISDSLSSKLRTSSSASEGMKLVVNFSYNDLTCHLKTCLLYLSMYPEGHAVCKDDLVKQWVAEGFIDGTEGKEVETAESYFHELIGRRFLQPECIKYNGEIASCSVHAVVRDLIAQKSLEENFVVVLDHYRRNVSLSEKVHRLSLHFPHTKYAMANIRSSQVWSLTCFGLSKCMPSNREFKLLRVLNLNLSGHDDDDEDIIDLTWISELLRLRYLKVASDVCIELPKHMGGLQYLETVDISKKVTDVPSDIINLPRLLHLHLPFETNLMDWLDITGPDANVWSFGKLTNLQYLYLTCFIPVPDQLQRNILSILASLFRGLRSLKTLAFILSSDHKNAVAHGPSEATVTWDQDDFAPPLLERFEWLLHSCSFSGVPKWIGKLGNLCTLKISVRELMRDGVNILGQLPALTTLSLHVKIPPFEMIIFDKAGFSVLKYFKFKCSTVPWLKFEADAMPKLQKLKLGFSAHSHRVDQQSTVPISIEHLPGLKEISAKVADASSDAESALMAAVSNHPRNPRIRMQLVDWNSYGHRVWYAVSKQETPLTLAEDNIPHPEEGLDDQLFPQYKDSRDDQNKEAYVSSHLKRGPWTPEEDGKLLHYIQKNGHGSWSNLPRLAGLNRCGKSCRLRWINYLRPEIKHDNFSQEEEQIIIHLHSMLGNKWSAIAKHLPGRTDNGIKNFWNTHLRKRLIQMGLDPVTHHPRTYFSATLREQLGCGAATDQSGASTGVAIVQQVAELQYLQSLLQSTAATIPASSSAPSSNTEAAAAAAAALDHGTIFSPQLTAALDSSTITTASLSSSMDSAISQLYHSRSRPRRLSAVKKMKPNQQQQQGLSSQALPEVGDSGLRSSARDERRCAASTNRVEHAPG